MVDKRYSIFVSSTFRDLIEERQAALKAILALGHFPVGMEVFPAAGDAPWEMISRIIADADYYVLIIAGRYGSTTTEGVSYTEREYNEAVKLGKQILAFPHEEPDNLPMTKSEKDEKLRRRLEQFRKKVMNTHTCKTWEDSNELALHITQSLLNAFDLYPAPGWVRSGGPDAVALLSEINELRQKVDALKDENAELRDQAKAAGRTRVKDFDPEEMVTLRFFFNKLSSNSKPHEVATTWGIVFSTLAPMLFEGAMIDKLLSLFGQYIVKQPVVRANFPTEVATAERFRHRLQAITLSEKNLSDLLLGLVARGLAASRKEFIPDSTPDGHQVAREVLVWHLTPEGQRLYLEQASI